MGHEFRYNIQHMGDIFIDYLEKGIRCVKSSTRGVTLTYNIHELKKKKGKLIRKIGAAITEIRKRSPELDVFSDETIMELFSKLDCIEESIEGCTKEREERLYPGYRPAEQV
jgi:hypothetical protein